MGRTRGSTSLGLAANPGRGLVLAPARYAFDFAMPAGTPIVAARAGTVLQVVAGFPEGGVDERFKNRANGVLVPVEGQRYGPYLGPETGASR